MDNFAVEARQLRKQFGDLQAVRGVDFGVQHGEVFSLLGPNGAGKSTTISMLAGLLRPSGGDASIMGHSVTRDARRAREALGMVPQDIALYPDLSARENLTFWGRMYGLGGTLLRQRVDETLETIGLTDRQHGRVGTFSGGMKRRVNIGVALLHHPQVVIMDEPTVGIDPQSRRHILDNVKDLNRKGMTVLYTTHYMEEASELSNHIAIMDQGQVIAYGTETELIKLVGEQDRLELHVNCSHEQVTAAWRTIPGVCSITTSEPDEAEGIITLLVEDANLVLPRLFDSARAIACRITSVAIHEPNLEAVFLHLTGRALRD
ncbi:MAG TPA: ABC transporter ATP-binding protein [Anaerolineae bacterium]